MAPDLDKFYANHPVKSLKIKNVEWEYISCGKGDKTFLIFPGGGQIAQSNFSLIKAFEKDYRVIVPTLYDVNSIEDFCKAVDTILEKEHEPKRLIIYGLSIGGILAQCYVRRNNKRVEKLIISHATAPKSKTYRNKIILPLKLLNIVLPIIPSSFFSWFSTQFAGSLQGVSNHASMKRFSTFDEETQVLYRAFREEFIQKYLNKRLLKTWINLHMDFYLNWKLSPDDLNDWHGNILILKTDNDPLARDDGEFQKLYPSAQVHTFTGTGHLTFYYQADKIIEVVKEFLGEK